MSGSLRYAPAMLRWLDRIALPTGVYVGAGVIAGLLLLLAALLAREGLRRPGGCHRRRGRSAVRRG